MNPPSNASETPAPASPPSAPPRRKGPPPLAVAASVAFGAAILFALSRPRPANETPQIATGTPQQVPTGALKGDAPAPRPTSSQTALPKLTPRPVATQETETTAAPEPTPTEDTPQTSSRPPSSPRKLVVFVPDDQGVPQKRLVDAAGDVPSSLSEAERALTKQAVRALMKAAPDVFPPNTSLQDVTIRRGVTTLHFSRHFTDPDFWQGTARANAALDSLAQTVAGTRHAAGGERGDGIRIRAGRKPVEELVGVDLSEPHSGTVRDMSGGGDP